MIHAPMQSPVETSEPGVNDVLPETLVALNGRRKRSRVAAALLAALKYVVGVLLCQRLLGAVLFVGWTNRLLRRAVLKTWWKQLGPRDDGLTLEAYLASAPVATPLTRYPSWMLGARRDEPVESRSENPRAGRGRATLRRLFGSLGANLREGLQSVGNLLVLTLPATGLWIYAWVLGWNISFFKLYEQSALGVSLGLFGVALFVVAMLYAPTAHVRQAVTGQWRSFYDFRLNWRLACSAPMRRLAVVACFAGASIFVLAERIVRYHLGSDPEIGALSDGQLRQWIAVYFLAVTALLLPIYVGVWRFAAAAYARGAKAEFARNRDHRNWRSVERYALQRLPVAVSRPGVVAQVGRATVRLSRWGLTIAACVGWSIVALEVYATQFFNYVPLQGWLNHPLIILPWIRYVPW